MPGAYVVGAASASLLWFFTLALGAAPARTMAGRRHLAPAGPAGGSDDVRRGSAGIQKAKVSAFVKKTICIMSVIPWIASGIC